MRKEWSGHLLSGSLVIVGALVSFVGVVGGALASPYSGWPTEYGAAYFAGLFLMVLGSGIGAFWTRSGASERFRLRSVGIALVLIGSSIGLVGLTVAYLNLVPPGLTWYNDIGPFALWLALLGIGTLTSRTVPEGVGEPTTGISGTVSEEAKVGDSASVDQSADPTT